MSTTARLKFRIIHRYLGFFLSGIMAVYAISGIVMIFRNTDFLKHEEIKTFQLEPELLAEDLGPLLKTRVNVERTENGIIYFKNGNYNSITGEAITSKMELPFLLEKMEHMHKATVESPLYYFNIFFGVALLFFVFSAFWMFAPKMPVFRKGMYFVVGGIVLTLIMLFV